ncbi:MAG: zinc ribbon domain-containing protein [Planctomycetes bacterium]|nr:zinc ribbon domain-containing protein [Planctomycetota bacterium]
MPIQVQCACGKSYVFDEAKAGRKGKCKACGRPLQVPRGIDQMEVSGPTTLQMFRMSGRHCPKCDTPLSDDAVWCDECGADLRQGQSEGKPRPVERLRQAERSKSATLVVVGVVVVAALAGAAFLLLSPSGKDEGKKDSGGGSRSTETVEAMPLYPALPSPDRAILLVVPPGTGLDPVRLDPANAPKKISFTASLKGRVGAGKVSLRLDCRTEGKSSEIRFAFGSGKIVFAEGSAQVESAEFKAHDWVLNATGTKIDSSDPALFLEIEVLQGDPALVRLGINTRLEIPATLGSKLGG